MDIVIHKSGNFDKNFAQKLKKIILHFHLKKNTFKSELIYCG